MRGRAVRMWAAALAGVLLMGASAQRPPFLLSADRIAARHRIQLPDGSQIMLRREYRVIFRTPMRWSEGMLLERVYVASRERSGSGSHAA